MVIACSQLFVLFCHTTKSNWIAQSEWKQFTTIFLLLLQFCDSSSQLTWNDIHYALSRRLCLFFYWWKIFGCMVGLYWILSPKCGTMLTNDLEFIWFRAARIIQTWPKWIWFGDDICICGFPVWKIKQQIGDIYNIVHQNRIEPLKQTA